MAISVVLIDYLDCLFSGQKQFLAYSQSVLSSKMLAKKKRETNLIISGRISEDYRNLDNLIVLHVLRNGNFM